MARPDDIGNGPTGLQTLPSLTIVILTHNETLHLLRVLKSIESLAARIVIVDSGSNDHTIGIANAHGASVFERDWVNYAEQFQWALDNCAIDTDWVMRLDADEWLGSDLVKRLKELLPVLDLQVTGISLDRRHYFMNRWIKYGGRNPLRLLRIWRTGMGHIEQRWMDEHIVLKSGQICHVAGEFVDENLNDLSFFTSKHNAYATREAVDVLIGKYALDSGTEPLASTQQAGRRRNAKLNFYNKLPLGIGPLAYFLFRYIVQLGFLDGRPGLIYHGLQGLWYRFLVDAKKYELERVIAACADDQARIDALETATGLPIRALLNRTKKQHSVGEADHD